MSEKREKEIVARLGEESRHGGRYKKGTGVPEPARCRRYETQLQIPRPSKDKRGARPATGSE